MFFPIDWEWTTLRDMLCAWHMADIPKLYKNHLKCSVKNRRFVGPTARNSNIVILGWGQNMDFNKTPDDFDVGDPWSQFEK